jgi:hypothetical protein
MLFVCLNLFEDVFSRSGAALRVQARSTGGNGRIVGREVGIEG